MSIFRETQIEWDGKEYTLVPDMKLLRRIEAGSKVKGVDAISLSKLVSDSIAGSPQVPLMAHVAEVVMHYAGASDFTEEEFYREMQVGDVKAASNFWWSIVGAISPSPKESKKPAAPDPK